MGKRNVFMRSQSWDRVAVCLVRRDLTPTDREINRGGGQKGKGQGVSKKWGLPDWNTGNSATSYPHVVMEF